MDCDLDDLRLLWGESPQKTHRSDIIKPLLIYNSGPHPLQFHPSDPILGNPHPQTGTRSIHGRMRPKGGLTVAEAKDVTALPVWGSGYPHSGPGANLALTREG